MGEYVAANSAILSSSAPVMSVELLIQQRRLEEQFCRRFVNCAVTGAPESIQFATAFSSCLREEAMEKYEAKPK